MGSLLHGLLATCVCKQGGNSVLKNLNIAIILLLGGVTRTLFLDQTRRNVVQLFVRDAVWAQHQGEPEILETGGHNGWY